MKTYTTCSFILMILVFLFASIAIVSLIAAFICSIIYAVKFKNAIPVSCNSRNFALSISLAIIIVLFFALAIVTLIVTKKYEQIKLTLLFLCISMLFFIIVFIILILIPVYSSNKQIEKTLPNILQKFLEDNSKCLKDFLENYECKTISNCSITANDNIKKKYKPIRKSSIILAVFADGSIIITILSLIFFFAPCPCGPIHDMNRF